MTPKEKAQELVEKMTEVFPYDIDKAIEHAKQCALICVEEILKDEIGIMPAKWMNDYWQQVKTEIESL